MDSATKEKTYIMDLIGTDSNPNATYPRIIPNVNWFNNQNNWENSTPLA